MILKKKLYKSFVQLLFMCTCNYRKYMKYTKPPNSATIAHRYTSMLFKEKSALKKE